MDAVKNLDSFPELGSVNYKCIWILQVLVKTNGATEGQETVNKNEKGMKIKEFAIIPYNSGHDAFMKCHFY